MDETGKRATGQLGEYATTSRDDRSMSEIMRDIVAHAQEIIRAEIKLAKVETREEARKLMQAGAMSAIGGVVGLIGVLFLCLSAMFAIALVIPYWAAALCVCVLLFIIGGAMLATGRERLKSVNKPERTIGEMKENVEWLKHPTRS
jgi:uncharacterized membrane protein YqjE